MRESPNSETREPCLTLKAASILFTLCGLLFAAHLVSSADRCEAQQPVAVPNNYVIGFEKDWSTRLRSLIPGLEHYTDLALKNAIVLGLGGETTEDSPGLDLIQAQLALFHSDSKLDTAYAWRLVDLGIIKFVEPNYIVSIDATVPNDPSFTTLWGLNNTSNQSIDLDAPQAWDITTGSAEVVVGVVDTGIDWNHPDLAPNIWVNPAETLNGIDDDGNGYIDDIHGWNGISDSGNALDDHNHGTHCAGTIGAKGNNGVGITGVAWNVRLMALKFLSASGSGSTTDAIEVINYAVAQKRRGVNLRILSNSWGGGGYSYALAEAIEAANTEGILFVAAAGNSAINNDSQPHYPSSYMNSNIVSVAAVSSTGALASFSNYGAESVDLGAPGVGIYSTIRGAGYAAYNGTSMATPHVSGVAALLVGLRSTFSALQLKQAILSTARPLSSLSGKTLTGAMANAHSVLSEFGSLPPYISPIGDQEMSYTTDTLSIPVTISDPDDDNLDISVEIISPSSLLAELDSSYDLSYHGGFNTTGFGEKWVSGKDDSIFWIVPGGNLFRHSGTALQFIASLGNDVYVQPSLLYDASNTLPPISLVLNENILTIDPPDGYAGAFTVRITAADQIFTITEEFKVTVKNLAPTLHEIPDATLSHKVSPITIALLANDPENDKITFTALLSDESPEYLLDKEHDFVFYSIALENTLGLQEKYVIDSYFSRYFILPDGSLYRFDTDFEHSTQIGSVRTTTFDNPEYLVNPHSDPLIPADISVVSLPGQTAMLLVTPGSMFVGTLHIEVAATDGNSTTVKTFTIEVTNSAPVIQSITDQHLTLQETKLEIPISVSDEDEDIITLTVAIINPQQAAYDLDQLYNFSQHGGTFYENLRGLGEKYLYNADTAQWFIILPDSTVYRWTGTFDSMQYLAKLTPDYYQDPWKLINVPTPEQGSTIHAQFQHRLLVLSIPTNFQGRFIVRILAHDGYTETSSSFSVERSNSAPTLTLLPNLKVKKNSVTQVELIGTDPDGDTLFYTVEVGTFEHFLYRLDQTHKLGIYYDSYYTNARGLSEKYIFGHLSQKWFVVLPNGYLYEWVDSLEQSVLIAQLPVALYLDPSVLFNRPAPQDAPPAQAVVTGHTLSLSPHKGFSGTFELTVHISDGKLVSSQTILVTVDNSAPTISPIADKRLYFAEELLDAEILASDQDDDPLALTAVIISDEQLMFHLDQQHDFSKFGASFYYNLRGENEKYVYGKTFGSWFSILPSGQFYLLDATFRKTSLIATLPEIVFLNPELLINARQPQSPPPAELLVNNQSLKVRLLDEYAGTFSIRVFASDGIAQTFTDFKITVLKNSTDSDGDGVTDLAELDSGSDPFDAGSFVPTLRGPIYTLWNGFLEMTNILELVNPNDEEILVSVSLYSLAGELMHKRSVPVSSKSQFDVILNEFPGFSHDSYGLIKLDFSGIIDGRVFYYRNSENASDYEFAFGVPLSNASFGRTSVGYNTYQPSMNPNETQFSVANWLTIVNLSSRQQRYTVTSYDQDGNLVKNERIIVAAMGRNDLDGGHGFAGASAVGLHLITPDNWDAPYMAQLIRYGGNSTPDMVPTKYDFAFPLVARSGTGRTVYAPISRQFSGENWLELVNTVGQKVQAALEIIGPDGSLLNSSEIPLPAFSQRHVYLNEFLAPESSGTVKISCRTVNSIIAQTMFYFRDIETGSIEAMYGAEARETLGRIAFGSYNRFLGMENWLRVANNGNATGQLQLIVNSQGGSLEEVLTLAPGSMVVLPLHDTARFLTSPDTYGTVELRVTEGALLFAELLRAKPAHNGLDFISPTTVR